MTAPTTVVLTVTVNPEGIRRLADEYGEAVTPADLVEWTADELRSGPTVRTAGIHATVSAALAADVPQFRILAAILQDITDGLGDDDADRQYLLEQAEGRLADVLSRLAPELLTRTVTS